MSSRLWLIIILLMQVPALHAQVYNFRNFSVDQGVPESRISAFCEDRRGNLWIGTLGGGLLRYDGYNFYTYSREDGLTNNFIHAIYEDTSGTLWIGTEAGICTYNGYRFAVFSGLEKQTVETIMQDASGELWFGTTSNGLYRYKGDVITKYVARDGVIDNTIHCFYRDKADNLWIGTGNGLVRYNAEGFRTFSTRNGLPSDDIRAITEDTSGNLWLATGVGISRLAEQTFSNYGIQHGLHSDDVHAVVVDRKGNLWAGTSGGLAKFNGTKFDRYNTNTGQRATVVTCMHSDLAGNLWVGSAEHGLSKLDCERFVHYPENDQLGKRVYAIVQALNGNIICGTSLGGATVFDGHQYTLADGIEGFTSSIIQAFYYTADSVLWVGTGEDGVYKFGQSQVTRYTVSEGLASNNITGFAADGDGNLWLASGDSGVSVMKLQTADSVAAVQYINTANGLASNRISAIAYDGRAGALWVATENMGLDRVTLTADSTKAYQITHFTTQDGLGSNVIHTLLADTLGHLYIGTAHGISVYDGKQFVTISKANGLGSNNVYALVLDNDRNLWAGTERGADRLTFKGNFNSYTIRHFGNEEGFKGVEVYRNSVCKDRNGNIWFGTVNGLVRYNPYEEVSDTLIPKVYIAGIRLFFDRIEDTPYADSVSAWYAVPTQLTLPYNQNNLTFSFVGIHQRNPQGVRYKWILEGFSKDWSPPIVDREATFSNLPPGEYTFKVMASNEYNVWNKVPAVYKFVIEPPLWERWWMRLIGALVFTGLIWMIFYMRLRRIQARNRIIQERLEMENSILTLEQEAARLQMNPHFIFNALNSIQGVISTNNAAQAKKYLSRFGRLMRLILENAREEFIPLGNEISMLENYLELEKLSANHGFDFSITCEKGIDPVGIEIPPMMIQPFVENAVVHGLKKKTDKGNVNIHFRISQDLLICEITDDGIGRKQAGQINGQTRGRHKSTGISVTTRRLEQYGLHRRVNAGIEIIDLVADGRAAGTRVIICTPFEGAGG